MRAIKCVGLLLSAVACAVCWGEPLPSGEISEFHKSRDGVEIRSGNARIRISVLAPAVVRLHYALDGTFLDHASWAVVPDAFPQTPAFDVKETDAALIISTAALRLEVIKNSSRLVFRDAA